MKARCGLLVLKSRPGAVVESLLALRRVSWPTRRRLDFEVFYHCTGAISGDIKPYLEVVAKPIPMLGWGKRARSQVCVSLGQRLAESLADYVPCPGEGRCILEQSGSVP